MININKRLFRINKKLSNYGFTITHYIIKNKRYYILMHKETYQIKYACQNIDLLEKKLIKGEIDL